MHIALFYHYDNIPLSHMFQTEYMTCLLDSTTIEQACSLESKVGQANFTTLSF